MKQIIYDFCQYGNRESCSPKILLPTDSRYWKLKPEYISVPLSEADDIYQQVNEWKGNRRLGKVMLYYVF